MPERKTRCAGNLFTQGRHQECLHIVQDDLGHRISAPPARRQLMRWAFLRKALLRRASLRRTAAEGEAEAGGGDGDRGKDQDEDQGKVGVKGDTVSLFGQKAASILLSYFWQELSANILIRSAFAVVGRFCLHCQKDLPVTPCKYQPGLATVPPLSTQRSPC